MKQDTPITLVDTLVGTLSRAIFRGEFLPGEKLPPLRQMAREHDVTVPTAQRAVARLEQMGLVVARQGSGVRVLEPRTHVGPGALPYWMDAVRDDPQQVRQLLHDFLELRRQLAEAAMLRLRHAEGSRALKRVHEAVDALESCLADDATNLSDVVDADLAVGRAILAARPQIAYAAVFNVFEHLLATIEGLAEAMYATAEQNVRAYRGVLALLQSEQSDASVRALVDAQLVLVDEQTIQRFLAKLDSSKEDA